MDGGQNISLITKHDNKGVMWGSDPRERTRHALPAKQVEILRKGKDVDDDTYHQVFHSHVRVVLYS